MLGSHTIRTYSSTQTLVSLSSGEAEYYSVVKGASQAMVARSSLDDLFSNAITVLLRLLHSLVSREFGRDLVLGEAENHCLLAACAACRVIPVLMG